MMLLQRLSLVLILLLSPSAALAESRRDVSAQAKIARLEQAVEFFRFDLGRYPSTDEGLVALVECPKLANCEAYTPGGYVKSEALEDPWGAPFQYAYPSTRNSEVPDIWTFGADSSVGGEGLDTDSGNWPGGFDSFRAARESSGLLQILGLGAGVGFVVGLPIYLWGIVSAVRGTRSWQAALMGEPFAVLIYLTLAGAGLASIVVVV